VWGGTTERIGTAEVPSGVVVDAGTIAINSNIFRLRIAKSASYVVPASHRFLYIEGVSRWGSQVDFNGKNFTPGGATGSRIKDCQVFGTNTGTFLALERCLIESATNAGVSATYIETEFYSQNNPLTITIKDATKLIDCRFNAEDNTSDPINLSFVSIGVGKDVHIVGGKGAIVLKNLTQASDIYVRASGVKVTIDSSCTAGNIIIEDGVYTLINNGTSTVTEKLPTNFFPQLLRQDLFKELRTGVVSGSYFDFLFPIIADNFNQDAGATSQVITALAANTSFQTGQEFAVIFTELQSGTGNTKRDGAEFMGSFLINQALDGDKKVWEIIGGYRMNVDATPVIVTSSKFGVCFSMADLDLASIPAGSPRWSGATDSNGEDDRTKAGWTFFCKQSLKTDGLSPLFPVSGAALQIRSLIGGFHKSLSAGGGDATLANQTTMLANIALNLSEADYKDFLTKVVKTRTAKGNPKQYEIGSGGNKETVNAVYVDVSGVEKIDTETKV